MKRWAATVAGAAALVGCNPLAPPGEVPAVITRPTEASRAELLQVVSNALGGISVMLAPDALTRSSLLAVERRPLYDSGGRRIPGRELGMPHRFMLVTESGDCVLVKLPEEGRWRLVEATCEPE